MPVNKSMCVYNILDCVNINPGI